ncbi:hypothetical protein A33M_1209 [Rhodovulum sp. PH10]|nr:hypothetical protein A33M_1209 [Rhodovulum sp. PH10]
MRTRGRRSEQGRHDRAGGQCRRRPGAPRAETQPACRTVSHHRLPLPLELPLKHPHGFSYLKPR